MIDQALTPPNAPTFRSPADRFVPVAPTSLDEAGIHEDALDALMLKCLLFRNVATGRQIADQLALPFRLLVEPLRRLKEQLLVIYKQDGPLGDYAYDLTSAGVDRARRHATECTYCGTAPVPFDTYCTVVEAQSVRNQKPRLADIRRALDDLILDEGILGQIGEAVYAGFGFFLSGAPGNGKTSIAMRVTAAFGETIWIPRTLRACGETIRLFDTRNHVEQPLGNDADVAIDKRWIRIRRPMIVAGGELTLDNLEIIRNRSTGICEAPLQLKSNCGTLLIDDFGRQRIDPTDMLNRWIVPLEKRYDYLGFPTGRKLQVPFDQLVIFSSNLEPTSLVDEAFLRRIPYKIEVKDPTENEYRTLFRRTAAKLGVACTDASLDYLATQAYEKSGRARRFCHPIALLRQVENYCAFRELPPCVAPSAVDAAVDNYFVRR
ncbi:MAG: AAA family ATPase [Pirellulales bacterium]